MRRLLTTLIILLVVLVAGMSALVLLVNPNDFRAYMVKQVEKKVAISCNWKGICAGMFGHSLALLLAGPH